jgi:hypothetical protein
VRSVLYGIAVMLAVCVLDHHRLEVVSLLDALTVRRHVAIHRPNHDLERARNCFRSRDNSKRVNLGVLGQAWNSP